MIVVQKALVVFHNRFSLLGRLYRNLIAALRAPMTYFLDDVLGKKLFGVGVVCNQPRRRNGKMTLRSADYRDHPVLMPEIDDVDLDRLVETVYKVRDMMEKEPFKANLERYMEPGDFSSKQKVLEWVKTTGYLAWHPVGTCKMGGADRADSVVDPRCRVIGVRGLRVADGSIVPRVVSGNTNWVCCALGAKAAAMILEDN